MNRRTAVWVVAAAANLAVLAVLWWWAAGRRDVDTPAGGAPVEAGSVEWVAGLIRNDAQVERVTRNVLNRYLQV